MVTSVSCRVSAVRLALRTEALADAVPGRPIGGPVIRHAGEPGHKGASRFPKTPGVVFTCAMLTNPRAGSRTGVSRRALLAAFGAGAVALAVGGCADHTPRATPAADAAKSSPLGPLYAETLALIATYDQAIAANTTLTGFFGPLREQTRQHAIALAALMNAAGPPIAVGPSPSGVPMPPMPAASPSTVSPSASSAPATPSPTSDSQAAGPTTTPPSAPASPLLATPVAARATLASAEKTAQANAASASLTAPASQVAVLASIAACRATHVAVLA